MYSRHYDESEVEHIAKEVLASISPKETGATVVGLSGNLGAGKTTLVQAIGRLVGVKETMQSPTFVIAKFYTPANSFDQLIHVDAYRIESTKELIPLRWDELLERKNTLIIIEWPEHIAQALPEDIKRITLEHNQNGRTITYD